MILVSFVLCPHYPPVANAQENSPPANVRVDYVHHKVQILDGGLMIINDTIRLSTLGGDSVLLEEFSLGFPIQFQSNLEYCFAYNRIDEELEVEKDVGLGELGFYGIDVNFPDGVSVSGDETYNFTVVFLFSGLIETKRELVPKESAPGEEVEFEHETYFYIDFPLYPSLPQAASLCNVTIIIPEDIYVVNSSYAEWVGARDAFNRVRENLKAFAYEETGILKTTVAFQDPPVTYEERGHLKLGIETEGSPEALTVVRVDEIQREITLIPWRQVYVSDFYHLTNGGAELSFIEIQLPQGAFAVSYHDQQGEHQVNPEELPTASIIFAAEVGKKESTEFVVTYKLPWEDYVNYRDQWNLDFAMSLFKDRSFHWVLEKFSVTIAPPEGAALKSSSPEPQSLKKSITFTFHRVTPFHNLELKLTYEYLIFWSAFRPTLWIGFLVVVGYVIASLWGAPKPPPTPAVSVSPEALRDFVEAYERKTRVLRELGRLEQQVRNRKISRRKYKMRKKALEGRVSVLSKDLTSLKEELRKAGSRYASFVRQIEVAETELEETERAIRRIKLRYRRREISKGTYSRLMEEYTSRKDRAETTIDGVLLRLREEIR